MPRTYDPAEEYQDKSFPKAGVDTSSAFWKQPARPLGGGAYAATTRHAVNVRAAAGGQARLVGGSRCGLARAVTNRVAGERFVVQELNVVYSASDTVPQYSLSGRLIQVVAVSQGEVYLAEPGDTLWVIADNITGETPPLIPSGIVFSAQNNQKMWFVDGTNYCWYNPLNGTVNLWTPTAGTLPEDDDGNTARLICTWRGRTVLSGLLLDPQNVFFSAVSDPLDFDYSPASPSQTQAVALNLSDLGLIGEPVMSLCPCGDDVLIVFCTSSTYALRGDPAAGGQIDRLSDEVGSLWGRPWAKDPAGNVYFYSNRTGIYRLAPQGTSPPVKISSAIDQFLLDLNTGTNHVRMAWDDRFDVLHVFITDVRAAAATTHLAYEARTGAWWFDRFANKDFDPLCCCTLDGNEPENRVVLIGSWDGYVRFFDRAATTDDRFPIDSEVWIGPLVTQNMDEILLKDLQAVLAEDSGEVTYSVHVGRSAQEAFNSEAVTDGVWEAGRGLTEAIRAAGHAIYVKLTASNPWRLEQIRARVATTGMVRRRG
jgi:hypothetical protein